ncbi:hypothetical protein NG799_02105 [Laspinema sp. D1]|uniref:Uncharacterized protein n=1 Tax=Laspinema palackyanum D2a TaxID=2953684 RepID=A0ABT2MK57_9CYAN|nr:hypothetical protein [Laspinema sp. D2a]
MTKHTIFTFHDTQITGKNSPKGIGFCYDLRPIAQALEISIDELKQAILETNSELEDERVLYTDLSDALFWLKDKGNVRADELIRQLVTDALYA